MIKIIAIANYAIGIGGGSDQAFSAILQMQRLSIDHFHFEVFTTEVGNLEILKRIGIQSTSIKISIADRLLALFSQNIGWHILQTRLKFLGPLERKLIQHECDLVYFLTPGNLPASLQTLNYINTVWDLSHRETPEFPEVRDYNSFFIREKNYQNNLGPAFVTLTDSQQLAELASHYYGIDRNRFIAMPFAPMPFLGKDSSINQNVILKKYNLESEYFFYPAQFWAHKNHVRILQAMMYLRDKLDWKPVVVFSGRDNGNLGHVEKMIKKNKLASQVIILGYVPFQDMRGLYENSLAVIMPTYFGPTNLPPLEAWSIGKPLIYSSHLAEQVGNAAILVDPDNELELAEAMLSCTKTHVRERLVKAGYERLAEIENQRTTAENQLSTALRRFANRRVCWS